MNKSVHWLRDCGSLLPEDLPKPHGHEPGQLLWVALLEPGLSLMVGPFHFSRSVIDSALQITTTGIQTITSDNSGSLNADCAMCYSFMSLLHFH